MDGTAPEIAQINALLGLDLRPLRWLAGGEQNGAQLVNGADGRLLVVKLQPELDKAERLLRAAPVIAHAEAGGWPVARWLRVGRLATGTAFVLQEYLFGRPVTGLDAPTITAVLAANDLQSGLACADAFDDSAQIMAVLSGDCEWKAAVADRTAAGADLVRRGDEVVGLVGWPVIPDSDVVHGDYSTSNMLITGDRAVSFIDCETVGKGTRVRDLADLYRQCFVYGGASCEALDLLRTHGCEVEDPAVFVACAVATRYNNLAWWVENKTETEFNTACLRLQEMFDGLDQLCR